LPVSLTPLGWTNCAAFLQPDVLAAQPTTVGGSASYSITVPNGPALDGARVSGQWIALDPSEPGGLTFSGATRLIVGRAP
jgi:hypothetical protein